MFKTFMNEIQIQISNKIKILHSNMGTGYYFSLFN